MADIEKRKNGQYRLRDRLDGKRRITIIRKLGIWKEIANDVLSDYNKARANGYVPVPPVRVEEIREFVRASKQGRDPKVFEKVIPIEEMCDLYVKHHGPSLKGAVSADTRSPYYNICNRVKQIKKAWAGKTSTTITSLDVRDFLARFDTVGTRMRYLVTTTHIFKSLDEWNKEGNILPFRVALPSVNPGKIWRGKMKASEKREIPDTRVLSPDEWKAFSAHLTRRAFVICELSLCRFLRMADIKRLRLFNKTQGFLRGIQQKTGDGYRVPVISDHPDEYDFTNFRKDFISAQVAAGMDYPKGHPLRFTFRSLRRTGATWAYRANPNLKAVSIMLGHRNTKITEIYLNITATDIQPVADAVDSIARRRAS